MKPKHYLSVIDFLIRNKSYDFALKLLPDFESILPKETIYDYKTKLERIIGEEKKLFGEGRK